MLENSYQNGPRNSRSQQRDSSGGPAPAVQSNGLHSSGGSFGSSYKTFNNPGMIRSRTTGLLATTKHNILSMIKCPCHEKASGRNLTRDIVRAHRGKRQPIIQSSDNTANCGQCGQFYGVKVSSIFNY